MNRISFSFKLFLILIFFAAPMTILMVYFQQEAQRGEDFSKLEHLGVKAFRPLDSMLDAAVKYQQANDRVSASPEEDIAFRKVAYLNLQREIRDISTTDPEAERALRTSQLFQDKQKELRRILAKSANGTNVLTPDDFSSLFDVMTGLIVEVGNRSNLILDPDIDTYYMMDTAILSLPKLKTSASMAHGLIKQAGARPLTYQERTMMTVLATRIEDATQSLADDYRLAVDFNRKDISPVGASLVQLQKRQKILATHLRGEVLSIKERSNSIDYWADHYEV